MLSEFLQLSKNTPKDLYNSFGISVFTNGISDINISLPFFSVITHFTCHFILLLGDFNACVDDETMKDFCSSYCLKSLIKQPTCFQIPEKPGCVDLT